MSCNEFIYLLIRAMIVHNIFKKHNCFNINDKKKSTNQHVRMISEGSSDTEDWSNAAENSRFLLNYLEAIVPDKSDFSLVMVVGHYRKK